MLVMMAAGVVNVPVCCVLAWQYGALGAAWSMVMAEAFVCIGIFTLMARHGILRDYLSPARAQVASVNDSAV